MGGAAALAGVVLLFNPPVRRGAEPALHMLPRTWFQRPGREAVWAPPAPDGAPTLTIRGQGVRVAVRPEQRTDIVAESSGAEVLLVRHGRDVDLSVGDPSKSPREPCPASRAQPLIVVRAPLDVAVRVEGGISGAVGRTRNLLLANAGCASWIVAPVEGRLHLVQQGPGRIRAASAKTVQARLKGRGQLELLHAREGLDAYLEGPGRIHAGRVDGPLDAELWGSGTIAVDQGFTTRTVAFIQGRGRVIHKGVAGTLYAEARGGVVDIAQVRGAVTASIKNNGDIRYERPKTGRYCLGTQCL